MKSTLAVYHAIEREQELFPGSDQKNVVPRNGATALQNEGYEMVDENGDLTVEEIKEKLRLLAEDKEFRVLHAQLMTALMSCAGSSSMKTGLSVPAIMVFLATEVALVPASMEPALHESILGAIEGAISNEKARDDMRRYMAELSIAMIKMSLGLPLEDGSENPTAEVKIPEFNVPPNTDEN